MSHTVKFQCVKLDSIFFGDSNVKDINVCSSHGLSGISSPMLFAHTVKNEVFQNSHLGCSNVHSSTTPNRVFLKPPFEGVTGHPQNTLTIGSESLKGVLWKYLHSIYSQLYVIVSDI